ncbi:MAG: AraC family transcriptional regulator [Clostridia bacterium]|nr:AraC family transcriptional regulator [Clostridia bacterium]
MLYQKILSGEAPYFAVLGPLGKFPEHRHADIELHYCVRGTLEIMIDKKIFQMHAGEIALICPMSSHAIPNDCMQERSVVTVMVGASFLKRHFAFFSNITPSSPIIDLCINGENEKKLRGLFEELAELYRSAHNPNDLLVTGILYQICAYLQGLLLEQDTLQNKKSRQLSKVENIEKALELIYYRYAEPIRIEDAAAATGYGKSNFCKIFKSTFGSSFHQALNQQRIQSSCILLKETNMSVSEIAQEVGLPECKSFCRIFKKIMHCTPGQYRKS